MVPNIGWYAAIESGIDRLDVPVGVVGVTGDTTNWSAVLGLQLRRARRLIGRVKYRFLNMILTVNTSMAFN